MVYILYSCDLFLQCSHKSSYRPYRGGMFLGSAFYQIKVCLTNICVEIFLNYTWLYYLSDGSKYEH